MSERRADASGACPACGGRPRHAVPGRTTSYQVLGVPGFQTLGRTVMHGPAITSYYTLSDPNAPGVGAAERKRIASIPAAWQAVKPGRDTGPQAPTIRRVPPDAGAARELADLFP